MLPTPIQLDERRIRVFLTCCDASGIGRTTFIDVDARNPTLVIGECTAPVLNIGRPGEFDDNGAVACSVLRTLGGELFMYYVGFELCNKVRYRLFTGLAVSTNDGATFERVQSTAILDRSDGESQFRCGPYVLLENGRFRLWYIAGDEWTEINGKHLPVYGMRYLESVDGVNWPKTGRPIFAPNDQVHGYGRPWVRTTPLGEYEMFLSLRMRSSGAYRMGHAKSVDGANWILQPNDFGLRPNLKGVDDEAIMYPAVINNASDTYCFYNGNGFGRGGLALAIAE